MIHWHCKACPKWRGVFANHGMEIKPVADLGQDRHAELTAAVGDHEVDGFGGRLFGRTHDVAFVFTVFRIDDDNDPAGADRFNGLFNSGKVMIQMSFRGGSSV